MKKLSLNNKGFGLIGVLVIILVLALAGGAGIYVYHKNHKAKATTTTVATGKKNSGSSSKADDGSTSTGKADPYAGWKTSCDSAYHYCFRYPTGWTISGSTSSKAGESGQVTVLNPAKTLQVSYVNSYTQDSGVVDFNTTALTKLTSASEDLTVVGGYYATSGVVGNFAPSYRVVDSSLLDTYPLTVGKASQFPSNPRFTDKAASTYSGSFALTPATSINTTSERDAWLSGSDTKTGVKILESLYYKN
jgi:hypothetical protein